MFDLRHETCEFAPASAHSCGHGCSPCHRIGLGSTQLGAAWMMLNLRTMMRAAMIAMALAWAIPAHANPSRIAVAEDLVSKPTERPTLYVAIGSAIDTSAGADAAAHKRNAELVRTTIEHHLAATPQLTNVASEARRFHLDQRSIDVSLVRLDSTTDNGNVVVTAELRVVTSDDHGKLLSAYAAHACAQMSSRTFTPARFEALRKQAIADASEDIVGRLRTRSK